MGVPLFEAEPIKVQGRLHSPAVLVGKIDGKLVQQAFSTT